MSNYEQIPIPTVPVELTVKIAGVEIYAGTVTMNSPPGCGDLPALSIESMVKAAALKQLPSLALNKNLPQLRGKLNEAGEAYTRALAEQREAQEAEIVKKQMDHEAKGE